MENCVRGRWMGIYNTAGMAGWAVGPILGSQMDPDTYGPFLAGAAMDRYGPPGFPVSLIAITVLYTLFVAWRQATRGRRMAGTVAP